MEKEQENWEDISQQFEKDHRRGKVYAGALLVVVGLLWFAKRAGVLFPEWLFSWQMFLIGLGLFIGAKHNFRGGGWIIPMIVGGIFLLEEFIVGIDLHFYIWPIVVIAIGLFMIVKPRNHRRHLWKQRMYRRYQHYHESQEAMSNEDIVEVTCIFGGSKKNIITKDFKGGDVTCVFGGAELNLLQADINGKVVIDCTQVFSGAKLIVPTNWKIVVSDTTSIFGSVEDKRPILEPKNIDETKVLVIQGTCIFGGIEITSY